MNLSDEEEILGTNGTIEYDKCEVVAIHWSGDTRQFWIKAGFPGFRGLDGVIWSLADTFETYLRQSKEQD